MRNDDESKPLRRIEGGAQTDMFSDPPLARPQRRLCEKGFVDPDPDDLVFGPHRLETYLNMADRTPLLIREVMDSLDWSSFEAQYEMTGRAPYHPRLILGLIVYAMMKGHGALRELENMAKLDLGAVWITGGFVPDHSTIGKFIQRHTLLIQDDFFEDVTREIINRLGKVPQVWAGDATVVASMANRFHTLRLEAAKAALAEYEAQPDESEHDDDDHCDDGPQDSEGRPSESPDSDVQESEDAGESSDSNDEMKPGEARVMCARDRAAKASSLQLLKQAVEQGEQRLEHRNGEGSKDVRICTTDPEAGVILNKQKRFGPGYVPSIISAGRLILACIVHAYSETQILDALFSQAKRISGAETAVVLMDTNYHGIKTAKHAAAHNLFLIAPASGRAPKIVTPALLGESSRRLKKHDFSYSSAHDRYECPNGKFLNFVYLSKDHRRNTESRVYSTSTKDCRSCPYEARCTSGGRRRVHRSTEEHYLEELRERQDQPFAKELYAHRQGAIEPVFSEMKGAQGLTRFRRRGIEGVNVEFTLHAVAHNLRRLRTELTNREALAT